jgi:outer membrane beta-barrel protein
MTRSWQVLPLLLALSPLAAAQEGGGGREEETFTVEETETAPPAEEPAPEPIIEEPAMEDLSKKQQPEEKLGETRVSWQDIVVVKHKPFLKMNRFELAPAIARTLNDNMIKHTALHAMVNYYLTDVLAVGAEALCIDICSGGLDQNPIGADFGETYKLVASQDRRLPTLNKYNFGAALNFHYSPIYAKFAVFNRKIVHLEGFFTAGVGFTQTEVVPRDPALKSWKNDFLITPNVGFTMRVFLFDWITLSLGVRDYIFIDKYESPDRTAAQTVDDAMENAGTKLINHIMFNVGVSFWLPTSFEYRTFR